MAKISKWSSGCCSQVRDFAFTILTSFHRKTRCATSKSSLQNFNHILQKDLFDSILFYAKICIQFYVVLGAILEVFFDVLGPFSARFCAKNPENSALCKVGVYDFGKHDSSNKQSFKRRSSFRVVGFL